MIEIDRQVGPLRHRMKWFEAQLSWTDSFRLVQYVQCAHGSPCVGFVHRAFQTKVIDLTASKDEIFGQFGKNTRYKIRRAQRDSVTCHFDGQPALFRRFCNQVAAVQGQKAIPPGLIEAAAAEVCISYARLDERILIMHCTLIDRTLGRARLWYSCSRQALENSPELQGMVGRANRLLHFEDMQHFKNQNLAMYDLGGYSADEDDRKQMAINAFKDGFGGRLLVESNYFSYPLFLAVRSRQWLTELRHRGRGARQSAPA